MLPRLIGWQKASALMMLGEKVSAEEAEKMGMIYKFFPDETFAENALNIAKYLSQMPTKGLAYTKRVLNSSMTASFEEQLRPEDIFQMKAAQTEDLQGRSKGIHGKKKTEFQR
jgi:2-(1,2-epoxy-1,2-dihydrophenyl)acetyl-CoA isomerase